jgi:hypothetical protein
MSNVLIEIQATRSREIVDPSNFRTKEGGLKTVSRTILRQSLSTTRQAKLKLNGLFPHTPGNNVYLLSKDLWMDSRKTSLME